jgi:hypothetical protein
MSNSRNSRLKEKTESTSSSRSRSLSRSPSSPIKHSSQVQSFFVGSAGEYLSQKKQKNIQQELENTPTGNQENEMMAFYLFSDKTKKKKVQVKLEEEYDNSELAFQMDL